MKNNRSIINIALAFSILALKQGVVPANAQEITEGQLADDSEIFSEQTFYHIEKLRLERWLSDNYLIFTDQALLTEVAGLKKEAEAFAQAEDFEMANVWLETIWSLLIPAVDSTDMMLELSESSPDEVSKSTPAEYSLNKSTRWDAELLTGVDLSRYGYELGYFEADSIIIDRINEREGNPYTGLRVAWEYDGSGRQVFQTQASYRQGLDHASGDASLKFHQPLNRSILFKIYDRLDGTSFYGDDNLRYFQNRLQTEIDSRLGPVTFELQDEFLIRRTIGQSSINYDYSHNALWTGLRYQNGIASSVGGGYRFVSRTYPSLDLNDYHEHRAECDVMQLFGAGHRIWLDGDLRWRKYASTPGIESQYHLGFNLMGELKFQMSRLSEIQLLGLASRTNYELSSEASLTDLLYWEFEPQLFLKPGDRWRFGFGAVFGGERYEGTFSEVASRSIQDYSSIGPSLEIEFLSFDGVMFTLKETYRFKRYPNSGSNVTDLSSYSDRNVNSISLFFSWSIDRHWRLNILASIADERLRHGDVGDFTNTVAGAEVSYGF